MVLKACNKHTVSTDVFPANGQIAESNGQQNNTPSPEDKPPPSKKVSQVMVHQCQLSCYVSSTPSVLGMDALMMQLLAHYDSDNDEYDDGTKGGGLLQAKIREKLKYEDLGDTGSTQTGPSLRLSHMDRYLHGPTPALPTQYNTSEDVLHACQALTSEVLVWDPRLSQVNVVTSSYIIC